MKVRCWECHNVVAGYESQDGLFRSLDHTRRVPSASSCCTHEDCTGVDFEDQDCPGVARQATRVPERKAEGA